MTLIRVDADEAIRTRIRDRMQERGMGQNSWSELSDAINGEYDRIQVGKWMRGDTDTIPAKFVEALDRHGFASAQWLISGTRGSPAPEDEMRLALVRRATTAELDELQAMLDATEGLQAGAGTPGPEEFPQKGTGSGEEDEDDDEEDEEDTA